MEIKMTTEERYAEAIRKLGGASGLMALPDSVKMTLAGITDLEVKTITLEVVASIYGKE